MGYLLGLLATAGSFYFGLVLLPSKLRTEDLQARRDAVQTEVEGLEASIEELKRDTRALEDDPWVVERALRARLGYLRPGERVYRRDG